MVLPEPLEQVFVNDPLPAALNEERDAINTLDDAVDDRIPFPSGAATGDLLRWDGTKWVTTETRFFEGNGRPDGQVAAPVGSRYIDKTGADGAVEWIKRVGDLNTGWICLAGQTGRRDISALIVKRTTAVVNAAYLIRINYVVELYIDITMPNNTASPYSLLTLPAGFRPIYNKYGALTDNKEGADTGGTYIGTDGTVNIYNPVAGKRDRYSGTWLTEEPWPTSLPGT